jgi:hypothetical protein
VSRGPALLDAAARKSRPKRFAEQIRTVCRTGPAETISGALLCLTRRPWLMRKLSGKTGGQSRHLPRRNVLADPQA